MTITAMKRALEALDSATDWNNNSQGNMRRLREASTELRSAIEAAEKMEPVAWRWLEDGYWEFATAFSEPGPDSRHEPLYAIPPDTARMLAEKDALLKQALTAFETDDFKKKLQAAINIRGYLEAK